MYYCTRQNSYCTRQNSYLKCTRTFPTTAALASVKPAGRPEELVVACNGSPMVIGLGTDHIYVASETAAFNRHTKNFIAMQDGEIALITPTECSLDKARMEQVIIEMERER